MTRRGVGWLFVAAQFALLLTLVALSTFPRTDSRHASRDNLPWRTPLVLPD